MLTIQVTDQIITAIMTANAPSDTPASDVPRHFDAQAVRRVLVVEIPDAPAGPEGTLVLSAADAALLLGLVQDRLLLLQDEARWNRRMGLDNGAVVTDMAAVGLLAQRVEAANLALAPAQA